MAVSPSVKKKGEKQTLLPFYVGITRSESLKGIVTRHTHYVLIEEKVSKRLGIIRKGLSKPGGADLLVRGVIVQTNRKKSKGKKSTITARRYITQSSKPITAFCKASVLNSQKKLVGESYSIGFPSNVPLRLIINFFKTNCPNVVRISTGGNMYSTTK